MGNPKIRNGFQEIRMTMTFKTNASQRDCAAFAEEVKEQTPILDNLANSIEITVNNVILD